MAITTRATKPTTRTSRATTSVAKSSTTTPRVGRVAVKPSEFTRTPKIKLKPGPKPSKPVEKRPTVVTNNFARNTNGKYHQGLYAVQDRSKCINKQPKVKYDSSIEYLCLHSIESKLILSNITRWGKETFIINYIHAVVDRDTRKRGNAKTHKYHMDFYIEAPAKDGKLRRILIETKDDDNIKYWTQFKTSGIRPQKGRRSMSNFLRIKDDFERNASKWLATEAFVKSHPDFEFYILGKKSVTKEALQEILFGKFSR